MNIQISFLNWNRPHHQKVAEMGFDPSKVVYCTNDKTLLEGSSPFLATVEAVPGVGASKNRILAKARELKADFLFIVEDDVVVKDLTAFERYADLSVKTDCAVTMYGYHSILNKALGQPNPAIMMRAERDSHYYYRFACGAVTGFDLSKFDLDFDEEILTIELEELLWRCHKKGIQQAGYGLYPDLWESHLLFDRIPFKTERIRTGEMLMMDKRLLDERKVSLDVETNLDKFLERTVTNTKLK